MNAIEQQLWDYIDGNLDKTQAKAIEEKINTDAEFKIRYEELLNLNLAFEEMELDEPSMSFTRNVMESIALQPAPVALKTRVNKNIIYAIGGFFVISLMAMFGYVLYNSNLQLSNLDLDLNVNFNWDKYITRTAVYCFLFADLVIGLVFLDHLMRKKPAHK